MQSYDVKDLGGPNTHGPEKYGREAAFLGSDTVDNDWSQSRGDAVHKDQNDRIGKISRFKR